MLDFRPVLLVNGILLVTLAAAMVLPAAVDLAVGNPDWKVFAAAAALTLFVGAMLALSNWAKANALTVRQAFVMTTTSWCLLPAFAALPLAFSDLNLSYTDAFFEAMSGITTTGSTVIVGLDYAPPGILLWRSLLQWLGGVGIIVMAVSVLPMLQVGGMQLFRMEFAERVEKALPRAAQIGAWIAIIYLLLTLLCAALYWWAGMSGFDAINHAMTTVATGGFSTYDSSVGLFGSARIEWIATVFMILGSLPFLLYLQALRGSPGALLRDSQVRWFFGFLLTATAIMIVYLVIEKNWTIADAIRFTSFNVTSVMTGTGYATQDFGSWGAFALPLFFLLMFIGGCAGSTTCGIKIFRFQVLYATAKVQMRRLLRPHGVFIAYYNRKPIPESVEESVMSFFFLFMMIFALLACGLGLMGLDFVTATSGAATAIANVGPGLGEVIGPAGTFASLPDQAKWLLSLGMLLGRLEIFTVLILLAPSFWRG
ncbi:MAG: TrkH family potassium uptake protein [Alphaproteobacteria bacterium]|nr:TrkH family potassium uptake protein [Alphaproteobacteria bacterium]MEC9265856.1 TrkH family potassium uptake protein [Pseudomonadota bacterium]